MSSNKTIKQQAQSTDEPLVTFLDAQLAYAKSKQGKAEKCKKTAYKKQWFKKEGK